MKIRHIFQMKKNENSRGKGAKGEEIDNHKFPVTKSHKDVNTA